MAKVDRAGKGVRMGLPRELPERPVGWTKRMSVHFNYGGGHGAGIYEVFNEAGEKMPIGWRYETNRKKGKHEEGFILPDLHVMMTWEELRGVWPAFLEKEEERRLLESLDD